MGMVYAEIVLENLADLVRYKNGHIKKDEVRRLKVSAIVDKGAYMLVIPEHIR